MAKPTKSARVLSECSQTKDEINARIENEEKLKGKSEVHPTQELTENQLDIFNFIKNELKESKLLSGLDSFLLTLFSITADRLQYIEGKINKKPNMTFNKDLISSKKAYTADFLRCCNELSLSPQSRAKLANINVTTNQRRYVEDLELFEVSILDNRKNPAYACTSIEMRDDKEIVSECRSSNGRIVVIKEDTAYLKYENEINFIKENKLKSC